MAGATGEAGSPEGGARTLDMLEAVGAPGEADQGVSLVVLGDLGLHWDLRGLILLLLLRACSSFLAMYTLCGGCYILLKRMDFGCRRDDSLRRRREGGGSDFICMFLIYDPFNTSQMQRQLG